MSEVEAPSQVDASQGIANGPDPAVCLGDGTTCVECGKVFSHPFYFSTHISIHTNEKSFLVIGQCALCGHVFSDPQVFSAHLTSSQSRMENQVASIEDPGVLDFPDMNASLYGVGQKKQRGKKRTRGGKQVSSGEPMVMKLPVEPEPMVMKLPSEPEPAVMRVQPEPIEGAPTSNNHSADSGTNEKVTSSKRRRKAPDKYMPTLESAQPRRSSMDSDPDVEAYLRSLSEMGLTVDPAAFSGPKDGRRRKSRGTGRGRGRSRRASFGQVPADLFVPEFERPKKPSPKYDYIEADDALLEEDIEILPKSGKMTRGERLQQRLERLSQAKEQGDGSAAKTPAVDHQDEKRDVEKNGDAEWTPASGDAAHKSRPSGKKGPIGNFKATPPPYHNCSTVQHPQSGWHHQKGSLPVNIGHGVHHLNKYLPLPKYNPEVRLKPLPQSCISGNVQQRRASFPASQFGNAQQRKMMPVPSSNYTYQTSRTPSKKINKIPGYSNNVRAMKSSSLEEIKKDSREYVEHMLQSVGIVAASTTGKGSKAGQMMYSPNRKAERIVGYYNQVQPNPSRGVWPKKPTGVPENASPFDRGQMRFWNKSREGQAGSASLRNAKNQVRGTAPHSQSTPLPGGRCPVHSCHPVGPARPVNSTSAPGGRGQVPQKRQPLPNPLLNTNEVIVIDEDDDDDIEIIGMEKLPARSTEVKNGQSDKSDNLKHKTAETLRKGSVAIVDVDKDMQASVIETISDKVMELSSSSSTQKSADDPSERKGESDKSGEDKRECDDDDDVKDDSDNFQDEEIDGWKVCLAENSDSDSDDGNPTSPQPEISQSKEQHSSSKHNSPNHDCVIENQSLSQGSPKMDQPTSPSSSAKVGSSEVVQPVPTLSSPKEDSPKGHSASLVSSEAEKSLSAENSQVQANQDCDSHESVQQDPHSDSFVHCEAGKNPPAENSSQQIYLNQDSESHESVKEDIRLSEPTSPSGDTSKDDQTSSLLGSPNQGILNHDHSPSPANCKPEQEGASDSRTSCSHKITKDNHSPHAGPKPDQSPSLPSTSEQEDLDESRADGDGHRQDRLEEDMNQSNINQDGHHQGNVVHECSAGHQSSNFDSLEEDSVDKHSCQEKNGLPTPPVLTHNGSSHDLSSANTDTERNSDKEESILNSSFNLEDGEDMRENLALGSEVSSAEMCSLMAVDVNIDKCKNDPSEVENKTGLASSPRNRKGLKDSETNISGDTSSTAPAGSSSNFSPDVSCDTAETQAGSNNEVILRSPPNEGACEQMLSDSQASVTPAAPSTDYLAESNNLLDIFSEIEKACKEMEANEENEKEEREKQMEKEVNERECESSNTLSEVLSGVEKLNEMDTSSGGENEEMKDIDDHEEGKERINDDNTDFVGMQAEGENRVAENCEASQLNHETLMESEEVEIECESDRMKDISVDEYVGKSEEMVTEVEHGDEGHEILNEECQVKECELDSAEESGKENEECSTAETTREYGGTTELVM